jgi:uncharacterized protein YpmB
MIDKVFISLEWILFAVIILGGIIFFILLMKTRHKKESQPIDDINRNPNIPD